MTETAPHANITVMETFAITLTILNLVLLLTFTITDRMKPSTSVEHALNLHRSAEDIKDASLRAEATKYTHRQLKVELELSDSTMGKVRHLLPAMAVICLGSFGTFTAIRLGYEEPPTSEVGYNVAALVFLLSSAAIAILLAAPPIVDGCRLWKENNRNKKNAANADVKN
ncbi:hypothetical protein [Corynebacterium sp.]|uniref:hypothetical protein n=1 Tax=Corynebacterium sp. TaxID=1720 RepID=UPI003B3A3D67